MCMTLAGYQWFCSSVLSPISITTASCSLVAASTNQTYGMRMTGGVGGVGRVDGGWSAAQGEHR